MDLENSLEEMLELEFRAGHNIHEAVKNSREIFGYFSVDPVSVQKQFRDFEDSGEYHDKEMTDLFPNDLDKKICRSLLSQICPTAFHAPLVTNDGRLGYCVKGDKFIVIDLFHGESRSTSIPGYVYGYPNDIEIIDDGHFLVKASVRLGFFEFDLKTMSLVELSSLRLDKHLRHDEILSDQLDKGSFVIYNNDDGILLAGRVDNGQISLSTTYVLDDGQLDYCKFSGKHFCGFTKADEQRRYIEFNLETRELTTVDVPSVADDENLIEFKYPFFWSGNLLYVTNYARDDECYKIATFNAETRTWLDIGIEIFYKPLSIYVDEDGFLTVIAIGVNNTRNVYRFAMRNPDSLQNLAWFSLSRQHKMTDIDGYRNLLECLPETSHLCLKLPEIVEEDEPSTSKEPENEDETDVPAKRHRTDQGS